MNKSKTPKKILALVLCVMMLVSVIPMSVYAAIENYNKDYVSETHDVFKHTEQTLAPGVEQYINYAYAKDGNQMVYYVTIADISRDDVVVQTSYKDQYRNKVLGMSKLTEQVASANAYYSDPTSPQFISEYYNVVAGVNASFYNMTTGQPMGITYIDGVSFGTSSYDNFFAVLKDGSAVIDYAKNLGNYTGDKAIMQAAGGSQWIVRDGKDVTATASGSYNTDRHCRTSVGITADGKVVFMALDGRQEPFSCGGSMHEIAQIMLEAGCIAAINLDGGGSTTYVAKQEGEDNVSIVNRPSDGSERSISAGLIIASTAAPSDAFDRAALTPEHEYITVNAKTAISAKGISPAGTAAEIPADAVLKLADDSFGTIENGIFVPAKTGDAVIQMVYNGKTVGETTVHIVVPDKISFTSTALATPYGKSSEIGLNLTYGEFDYVVAFDAADVNFTLSDGKFGTVSGLTFNATSDTTVTGSGTITATVVGTSVSATVPLNVGKGSEVIFDFEDASVDGWGTFDYYNANVSTIISVADAKSGKVHSGNYSMAYSIDFSQLTYYEDYITSMMTYNADSIKAHGLGTDADGVQMYGTMDDYVDITGATGLGFWVYLPDEVDIAGLNPRFVFGYKKTATDAWTRGSTSMNEFLIKREGMGSEGWYYFYADLSAFSGYYAMTMQNNRLSCTSSKNGYKAERYYGAMVEWYIEDRAWKNNKTKSYTGKFTLFIDDITVDYSSVVDDREPPVFGEVSYAATGMSDSAILKDNATIVYNGVDFAASVSENTKKSNATGINPASAKAYIDGNVVAAEYKNGKITVLNPVDFADGVHTVKFEIADRQGNVSHIVRTFTMDTGSSENTVKVIPRDADMTSTLVGSLYYIDIVATDISAVNTVSVTLKVNNVNDWEPAGIVTANGFSSEYSFDPADNGILELTLRKTSTVSDRGEAVIASVPVRAWYPHNALGKDSNWIITQKKCVYPMDIQLLTKAGRVVFEDGTFGTFSSAKIQIDSEAMCAYGYIGVNKGNEGGTLNVTSWHEHTAVALADKAATCTEAGYTGRTFCEVCNSVVDWGTTVPATGHSYALVDGVLKCTGCDTLFNGVWTDGKTYVDGVAIADGWNGDSYYVDGVKLTGLQQIDGYYYDFGEDGVCEGKAKLDGFYYDKAVGKYMYFTAGLKITGEVNAYPTTYFFGEDGYAISGDVEIWGYTCTFDEKGAFVSATDASVVDAGFSGTNLNYVLLSDGTLMVGGEGIMKDYTANGIYPAWIIKNEPKAVTSLVIGNGITHIGRFGFYRNQFLKSVSFEAGSTLESIGWGAFGHCWRLETVTIPASVEVLEGYAFYECGAMKSFTFEEGSRLHTIENCAFRSHHVLESLVIPDSVTTMGPDIFYRANPDLVLNVVENSVAHKYAIKYGMKYETREGYVEPMYSGEYNDSVKWDIYPSGKLVISGTGAMPNHTSYTQQPWRAYAYMITGITIGKDITSIGNYAFAYTCKNVNAIEFEAGSQLQSVGAVAFMNVANVKDIVLPDTVTYIGVYAFGDCYALETLAVSQAASYIASTAFTGSANVVLNVAEGTYAEKFANANGISYTTRTYAPIAVASGTFDNLTWTLYDNGTLEISGDGAMTNLTNYNLYPWHAVSYKVNKIVIGKGVTSIGNYAFAYGFKNAESIVFESGSTLDRIGAVAFMNVANVKDIVLPDTVTYIGAYAFGDCYALETLAVSQMAAYIAPTAFAGSANVVLNVVEGTYAETFAINHGLSYTVREYAVLPVAGGSCGANATWTLYSDGTLAIGGSGNMDSFQDYKLYPWFAYANKVIKITIGKDITKIGNYAFAYYYQNLETVEFEAGSCLTFVGAVSFMNCAKLQTVVLPESVTYIGVYAFADCYALENVYVPAGVTFIGNTAFAGSGKITVSVASGSYAETFVKSNGINHVVR